MIFSPFTHYHGVSTYGPVMSGSGIGGLGDLSWDGTGLFGSGLFGGDITTWGLPEIVAGAIGLYALYSMTRTTRQGYRTIREGAPKLVPFSKARKRSRGMKKLMREGKRHEERKRKLKERYAI